MSEKTISKCFNIGNKKFGLIQTRPGWYIVMTNYMDIPKSYKMARAGRGGYVWHYLPSVTISDTQLDRDVIREFFGLYKKSEQNSFIKK